MRHLYRMALFIIIITSSFIVTLPVHAGDATVSTCDFASLSTAVTTANTGGGIITFACSGTITFTSQLSITADVTINANGNAVIFNGNNATGLFAVSGTLSVDGFTFQNGNGSGTAGGAIMNFGTVIVTNSNFINNATTPGYNGGAIQNNGTSLTISNSHFTGNSAHNGGAIRSTSGTVTITNSTFVSNTALIDGGSISTSGSTVSSQGSHFEGGNCFGTITDNGGNTNISAVGCPGVAPVTLSVSALSCSGNDAVFTINAGDANFNVTGTGGGLPQNNVGASMITLTGPSTWTNVTVSEMTGNQESVNLGGITCPAGVVIPPSEPAVTVLGCALDTTDGVELANAPDNTYCRVLMKNGGVVSYSGAVPANLISLGVVLAVDVYRLVGGMSQNSFPDYARVCLSGSGRLFYMDARQAPRVAIELTTEAVDGLTCGWIPAPGTLILTR